MPRGALFTTAAYVDVLQHSGSATPATGWTALSGADLPTHLCWRKAHSWGEFVFDHAFAEAYTRAGQAYYPKLVCAVPFTPVPGPRLGPQPAQTAAALLSSMHATEASSVHILFARDANAEVLPAPQWWRRTDVRYVWRDADYGDFEGFLAALTSKRRKTIRAERRRVSGHGLAIQWHTGAQFTAAEWARIEALYASTYQIRGQAPYLQPGCLQAWAVAFGAAMQFCVARDGDEIAAMAFFFRDEDHLYGRHWGAARDWDGLHFELCYYQGIEYCLRHGLRCFDAGVQGQHRLLRGFVPERSHSWHSFRDPRFHAAIGDYLAREQAAIDAQWESLLAHVALRRTL